MTIPKSLTLLYSALGVCVAAIVGLGIYSWNLHSELDDLQQENLNVADTQLPTAWPRDLDPWSDMWDSSGTFERMQKRMDEMMNAMVPDSHFFNSQGFGFSRNPTITMDETNDEYQVVVNVPEGQDVEINTEIDGDMLTITGKVKTQNEESSSGYQANFFQTHKFSQSLTLPGPINEQDMRVKKEDGKIVVTIPKAIG